MDWEVGGSSAEETLQVKAERAKKRGDYPAFLRAQAPLFANGLCRRN